MTRRPAVTLMEVLIAMFIMAIGMLALMALFPVGAVSMAQALKDDRCASTAAMAENVAIAMNVRDTTAFTTGLAYVDPYGVLQGLATLGGVIPRSSPSFVTSAPPGQQTFAADRWFSLPDDVTFNASGTADTSSSGGIIDRGRRYSYAYFLRQLPSSSTNLVQLYVVVYAGRPVNSLAAANSELTFNLTAPATAGTNTIVVNATGTTMKRGGWILDPLNGYFYRVTNLTDNGVTTTVELQQNVVGLLSMTQILVMDYVAEVFDKGTGWQP